MNIWYCVAAGCSPYGYWFLTWYFVGFKSAELGGHILGITACAAISTCVSISCNRREVAMITLWIHWKINDNVKTARMTWNIILCLISFMSLWKSISRYFERFQLEHIHTYIQGGACDITVRDIRNGIGEQISNPRLSSMLFI